MTLPRLEPTDPRYQRLRQRVLARRNGQLPPAPTRRVSLPCRWRGDVIPPRFAPGTLRKYYQCLHPEQPLGPAVCGCRGCGPRCRGYEASQEEED